MKLINSKSKRGQQIIRAYNFYFCKNKGNSLYEIYKSFSNKKNEALIYCNALRQQYEGFNQCFCGHNINFFTYAFMFIKYNKTYIAYITRDNDYYLEYEE